MQVELAFTSGDDTGEWGWLDANAALLFYEVKWYNWR